MSAVPKLLPSSPEYEAFVKFARLTQLRRDLQEQLDGVKAQLEMLEPEILSYLGGEGYQMVRVEGFTLSPHREPWIYPAEGRSRDDVCRALKESDLAQYVTENYNTRSLTKYVRDLEKLHEDALLNEEITSILDVMPAPLARVISVKPAYYVQAKPWKK